MNGRKVFPNINKSIVMDDFVIVCGRCSRKFFTYVAFLNHRKTDPDCQDPTVHLKNDTPPPETP